jgi:hypothetical protein
MPRAKVAPYGSWRSPLTAGLVASRAADAQVPGWAFGELLLDGEDLYWMEGRPQPGGLLRGHAPHARRASAGDDPAPL